MKTRKMIYKGIALMLTLVFCLSAISCRRENENVESDDGLYTVSFAYGYSDKVLTEKVASGASVTKPDEPLRVGYDFGGWWISDGGEERLWDFEKDVISSDITLTAKWSSKKSNIYTITLNANGGVCEVEKIQIRYGEEYSLPIPTREGYYFFGWTNISNEGVWNYPSDMTITAKWLNYPPGMTIKIGRFEQDNDLTNGAEEIEWDVIKYENGKYFVISKYILTAMRFSEDGKKKSWSDSTLRRWMNGEFFETAFSEEERKYIQDTYIKSESTTDKIFCISYGNLVSDIVDRRVKFGLPTEYALSKGIKSNGIPIYYTEDENKVTYDFFMISGKCGSANSAGMALPEKIGGVRPAMWVSEEFVESFIK